MTGFSGGAAVAIVGVAEIGSRSDFFCSAGVGGAMTSSALEGSGAGVSSTVECLPVVHGGMARNSSKVKTRGLQHFQPEKLAVSRGRSVTEARDKIECHIAPPQWSTVNPWWTHGTQIWHSLNTKVLTFLPLVEHWGTRMIHAVFFRVGEGLSTRIVDTLACHDV